MAGFEEFIVGCILVTSLLLTLSFAVLIKKGDYGHAIRYWIAIAMAIVSAEMERDAPESSGALRNLSIVPLLVAIYISLPVVRRAWALLRGGSGAR